MRPVLLAAVLAAACLPALAQTQPHKPSRRPAHPATTEKPVDTGPFTPDANRAYQGGGVVLQGAPGAPAPAPQATPPGQAPSNAVGK